MTSEYQKMPNLMDDGLSTELMNAGRLCFNCEQIFSSRRCLEEHHCPVPSFICSCGSEFMTYHDMLQHNRTHEPGYQVLCHETIKKRRIEKHWEEEEKLQRLQSGEVVWESPKPVSVKVVTQMPTSSKMTQGKVMPYAPQASPDLLQNVSISDQSQLFSNVGAPTFDLWTLFQPVVVMKSMRSSSKTHVYTCGKCGQTFATRRSLVMHHNTHIADKVSGCISCGLLLASRKIVPRFHACTAPHVYKFKLITAKPLSQITANIANSLAKMARSSPSVKAQNNGSYSKLNDVLGVQYNTSDIKKPLLSIQTQSISSNANTSNVNTPAPHPAAGIVSQTPGKGYECRVCHVFFESINVLQRHKCAKAHEFLLKHKLAAPVNRQRQVIPLKTPGSSLQNVSNTLLSAPIDNANIKNKASNVNNKESTTVVSDDDCFIVESGSEKPAEVIYQVTSSVPIKT